MSVIGDGVGGNLNMSISRYVGGELLYVKKYSATEEDINERENFTLLLLNLLTGEPLVCILISTGKKLDM